jgi:hypothetical protein
MGASALHLGMAESAVELETFMYEEVFDGDVNAAWRGMREWRQHAVRHGLVPRPPPPAAAEDNSEETVGRRVEFDEAAVLQRVIALAHDGLKRRGLGEEEYLGCIATRLDEGANPGQRAIAMHRTEGGSDAIVRALAVSL